MNHPGQRPGGKILKHGHASGITDDRDVAERAREIARIQGHPQVTKSDRRQAERELNGEDVSPVTEENGESRGALSRDPSEPVSDFGHQVPDLESEDEQFAAERLVTEGVNEAEHDQRLAARRRRQAP